MLRALVGGRAEADPGAAEALAARCARLPLALGVAAEYAVAHPAMPLAWLAAELASQQRQLDLLDAGGDPRTAVRAVFSWFARHLDAHGISWRWYSSDVGSLRLADELYCLGHHDRFAYFTKTSLPWTPSANFRVRADMPSFLEDAARGVLPSVSWIDPNWGNFNPFGFQQNDDHPPADVKDGQDLVLAVYHALATSPQWEKTLLVIFYDERGGFFDHVPPPEAADDDPATFGRYGPRVPALMYPRGLSRERCRARSSTTPRSSRRSCCGSVPPTSGRAAARGAWARGSRRVIRITWGPESRAPTTRGHS